MRIALDLDGTCYHWDRTARYLLRRHIAAEGRPVPDALYHPSRYWDHIQDTVSKKDWEWLWTVGVERGLFRHGHVVSGSIEGLTALVEQGHAIVVCTARPPTATSDTLAWLNLHMNRVPLEGVVFSADKSKAECDLLIDDNLENCLFFGGYAALLLQPWSITGDRPLDNLPPGIAAAHDWYDVVQIVRMATEGKLSQ